MIDIQVDVNALVQRLKVVEKDSNVTFSDYIISRLLEAGCPHVFSLTGGGIMYLVDAIAKNEDMELVCVHNEQFAGAAADAYARVKDGIGCAMGTTGPGLANLFTAVAAAYQDSSPVLFLGGQVKSADSMRLNNITGLRQNGTFEFDSIDCYRNITKYCEIIPDALSGIRMLEEALYNMVQGRPGPSLIEIPLDIQGQLISISDIIEALSRLSVEFDCREVPNIAEYLQDHFESDAPLLIVGAGVLRAGCANEFKSLLKQYSIPYVVTPQAIELADLNENYGGVMGLRGNRSANILSQECDSLIVIGSSLHQQIVGWESKKFNPEAKKNWFEIDSSVVSARKEDLAVTNIVSISVEDVLIQLERFLESNQMDFPVWEAYICDVRSKYLIHAPKKKSDSIMCYYEVVHSISSNSHLFHSVVTDAGMAWYIIPQALHMHHKSFRFVSSGSFGAMGMAIPYGLGVSCANNGLSGELTLVVTGDGSMMTCIQELASLKAAGCHIVIIVVNNNGYRSIRTTHDKFFEGRKIGTDGSNGVFIPSISEVANAFGFQFERAVSRVELDNIFSDIEQSNNTQLIIEVVADPDQTIEPMVSSVINNEGNFETPSIDVMFPSVEVQRYYDFKQAY